MLKIFLMDNEFKVPCEKEEEDALIQAATMLEDQLEQASGRNNENKALMVALNICYDYIQLKNDTMQYCENLDEQLTQRIVETVKQASE